jgi:hypothetical protein
MKVIIKIFVGLMIVLLVISCQDSDTLPELENDIVGSYSGSITWLDPSGIATSFSDGITDVIKMESGDIEIHCYGEGLDTTLVLNHFQNLDSVNVCLTGPDFEQMYGHMLGAGHNGSMMGDMNNNESEWQHHMSDEHDEGDEHFGGFDMSLKTFGFDFKMKDGSNVFDLKFQGEKK